MGTPRRGNFIQRMLILLGVLHLSSANLNCTDFKVLPGLKPVDGSAVEIEKLNSPKGPPQCENECRRRKECVSYSIKKNKKWCTLYSTKPFFEFENGYITGTKNDAINSGDQISAMEVNYCREQQRKKFCVVKPGEENFDIKTCDPCPLGFKPDRQGCYTSCACRGERNYKGTVFGDLRLSASQIRYQTSKDGRSSSNDVITPLWDDSFKNGSYWIPYNKNLILDENQNVIRQAMDEIESNTCLKFIERDLERDYLEFIRATECSSQVGRQGGKQKISLGDNCYTHRTITHEIMHALGFWHEQNRPDRDDYVKINLENVDPEQAYIFNKMTRELFGKSLEYDYDIQSIMHYPGNAFSNNNEPTIIDKRTNQQIQLNEKLSVTDLKKLNDFYPCQKATTTKRTTTTTKSTTTTTNTTTTRKTTSTSAIEDKTTNPDLLEDYDDSLEDSMLYEEYSEDSEVLRQQSLPPCERSPCANYELCLEDKVTNSRTCEPSQFIQTSGWIHENHIIGNNLTFWKRYELSFDLNIAKSWMDEPYDGWKNVIHFRDSSTSLDDIPWKTPGYRVPAIFQRGNSNRLRYCNFISNLPGGWPACYEDDVPVNEWFNVKFVQAKEDGEFRYSIFIDGKKVHSVINTTPRVWSAVEAETGRTWLPPTIKETYRPATGSRFRNLQLFSFCQSKEGGWLGKNYEGEVSTTRSGRKCQAWASKSPHNHGLNSYPGNFCRNPDDEPGGFGATRQTRTNVGNIVMFLFATVKMLHQ